MQDQAMRKGAYVRIAGIFRGYNFFRKVSEDLFFAIAAFFLHFACKFVGGITFRGTGLIRDTLEIIIPAHYTVFSGTKGVRWYHR